MIPTENFLTAFVQALAIFAVMVAACWGTYKALQKVESYCLKSVLAMLVFAALVISFYSAVPVQERLTSSDDNILCGMVSSCSRMK